MSTPSLPNDTHEGIQRCLDGLHDRRSALGQAIEDARQRGDNDRIYTLDIRHAEVCGLIRAVRAGGAA